MERGRERRREGRGRAAARVCDLWKTKRIEVCRAVEGRTERQRAMESGRERRREDRGREALGFAICGRRRE